MIYKLSADIKMKGAAMHRLYTSTRNNKLSLSASECILKGLSDDGGLFVPAQLQSVRFSIDELAGMDYRQLAQTILSSYLDDFSDDQTEICVSRAYNTDNFGTDEIFPLVHKDGFSILELFTGRTLAFKDAALSLLPHLMSCAKDNTGESRKITILTATSGDTGKAALEGFRGAEGIDVIVFYPYKGVSDLQLLQMLTQEGSNVFAFAFSGNFDDTQTAVKNVFSDTGFAEELDKSGIMLSSANSINIGRLLPQIVYYYYAYIKLLSSGRIKAGEKINFAVPTGNFGNILAGYYAKMSGLPINMLICASNDNNVLSDFFTDGTYDSTREFRRTISPSMDILVSSNLERLIYEILDRDSQKTAEIMACHKESGSCALDFSSEIFNGFAGGFASEDEIRSSLKDAYQNEGYLFDTHTACAYKVYKDYIKKTGDNSYTVILSTASPFKFAEDVYKPIFSGDAGDEQSYIKMLSGKTGICIPDVIKGIENLPRAEERIVSSENITQIIKMAISREL